MNDDIKALIQKYRGLHRDYTQELYSTVGKRAANRADLTDDEIIERAIINLIREEEHFLKSLAEIA